jgi:hypothetical protein
VLEALETNTSSRYVLTIHSKPRAVMLGTEAFLELLRGYKPTDKLLALQLGALVQGLEANLAAETDHEPELDLEEQEIGELLPV